MRNAFSSQFVLWIGLLLGFADCESLLADPVKGIRPAVASTIAPPSGEIMIPLTASRSGDHWPQIIDLELDDGRIITGTVAWIAADTGHSDRHWSDEARNMAIRNIQPSDNTAQAGTGDPHLFAQLPSDYGGDVRLLDKSFAVRSIKSVGTPANSATHRMSMFKAPDRPDPTSPFAYWRWALLADELGQLPPTVDQYGLPGRLVAQHESAMWRSGIERLAKVNPNLAKACRSYLTRICVDYRPPTTMFAAWETNPIRLGALLKLLLSEYSDENRWQKQIRDWLEQRRRTLIWVEAEWGSSVRLAVTNLDHSPRTCRFYWQNAGTEAGVIETIQPGILTRVTINRPEPQTPSQVDLLKRDEPDFEVLVVQTENRIQQVIVSRGIQQARPPAAFQHKFKPPLRLFEVRSGVQRNVPEELSTWVELRRLEGRWELFAMCFRPQSSSVSDSTGSEDTLVLYLGPDDSEGAYIILSVPEQSWHQLTRGHNDGSLQIHRRSYEDHWRCRIVLPDSWLDSPGSLSDSTLLLGVMRTGGDHDLIQSAPRSVAPWRSTPPRSAVNLSTWTK